MDYIFYVLLGLIVIFFVTKMMPTKGIRNITTEVLKNELNDKDKQFVDVRTSGEYKGHHIRQFKNIPLNQIAQKSGNLSKEKEVVVICQSGMRSQQAAKILKKLGFNKITNVKGGMNA